MDKKLVIVESPAKAKTIAKILGADYIVKSSVGHIRDLPERTLGVDVKKHFEPEYVISKNKTKVVEELRKAAKSCSEICLAPDPDREGEAIAWHLKEVLEPAAKGKTFSRVQYNEITPRAVRAAFENPGEINMDRVNAQQARRVLDRIVGYQVSPMLWRRVKRGLSAGRVQSVALRLICERERLIEAFKIEAYWVLGALLRKDKEGFGVKLAKIDGEKPDIRSEETAKAMLADLEGRALKVADVRRREITRRPMAPFITSTLQQAASSVCGFSPSRTMSLAQSLYEGVELGGVATGLITYMRTDSVAIARDAQAEARAFIEEKYGEAFYPKSPNFFSNRSNAQEAHEAIRPTDVTRTPESLKGVLSPPEMKLYDLIWRRFVASQMAAARIAQRTVEIASVPPPKQQHAYLFTATASDIVFPGFLQVMALDIKKAKKPQSDTGEEAEEDDEVDRLPQMEVGETVVLDQWLCERKETKPPSRFSEASLIKALEANGVGRPSTYASIIETLDSRKYATREKKQIAPTELGCQVNDLLVDKLNALFDVGFTAQMEEKLDRVEAGEVEWSDMLADFYGQFTKWMQLAKEPPADPAKVAAMLGLLEKITTWADPVKYGKRTLDDAKFVASIREQREAGEKPISDRQLESLAKMALRYRAQLPQVEQALREAGLGPLVDIDQAGPSNTAIEARFTLLEKVELSEDTAKFVNSLREQAQSGRTLSPAQMKALDRIVVRNASQIPDAEARFTELGITLDAEATAAMEPDTESPDILAALGQIATWAEPVKKGKATYDDKEFFNSLSEQFARKKWLSPRQRFVLKRMVNKYAAQIPDHAALAAKLGLKPAGSAPARGKGRRKSAEAADADAQD